MYGFKKSAVLITVLSIFALQYSTFGYVFLRFVFTVTSVGSVLWLLGTYDHDYWRSQGVFSPPGWPFVGHIKSVVTFQEQGGTCFKKIYDKYRDLRFLGTHQFFQRTLVVRDPTLIRRICVTDFQHFVDRGFFFNKDVDPLAGSVLFLRGNEWRKLRTKISPIFSPNKLKGMLPLIDKTAVKFITKIEELTSKDHKKKMAIINDLKTKHENIVTKYDENHNTNIDHQNKINSEEINAEIENSVEVVSEKLFGGYTADAIVPCAFGLESRVMDNDHDPFAVALQSFYEMSPYNVLEKTMRQFWPAFVMFFKMRIIPKKAHDFFYNIVTAVLRARENGVYEKRGDFIDMMMALRSDDQNNNKTESSGEDVEITDMVISANAFIIFLGGFETTSSTLAFMLLELSSHPEVQEKMRREVVNALEKHKGIVSYSLLQELHYIDMVIQETLRLYPPFPNIQRMCTKDYRIPGTEVTIETGTVVLFPTLAIQRDEQFFANAEEFIPERWAEDSIQPPPGVYMPFGDGPRYCIGKRFAQIQMKCCLVRLLPRVQVSPAPRAPPRRAPYPADPRIALTLHPYDSKVTLSLL